MDDGNRIQFPSENLNIFSRGISKHCKRTTQCDINMLMNIRVPIYMKIYEKRKYAPSSIDKLNNRLKLTCIILQEGFKSLPHLCRMNLQILYFVGINLKKLNIMCFIKRSGLS